MSLFSRLKQRAAESELMDDLSAGGPELREALRHLRRLNRIFGASAPTLYGVRRLWAEADKPSRFSILDIGSGSGDVNRKILRWADANRIKLKITLADITEEACEEAGRLYRDEPRVRVMRSDVFQLPEGCADVITGTQFVHHFASDELPEVARSMLKASRIGVVINDIHRHWIPWAAVWLTARIVSRNRFIVNDGPLSVAKGFRSADWEGLKKALGESEAESELWYTWRPLFRYAAVIRKKKVIVNQRSCKR